MVVPEYDTRMLHHFFDRLVQGNLYHDRAWVTTYIEGMRTELRQILSNAVQLKLDKFSYSRPLPSGWQPDQLLSTSMRLLLRLVPNASWNLLQVKVGLGAP